MSFFYKDDSGKCRVVKAGQKYKVQWKPNDLERDKAAFGDDHSTWRTYLVGTADFLGLTAKEIEWADAAGV